jgi:hypothetical protein
MVWVRLVNSGQNGLPSENGSPILAKLVLSVFVTVASCCCCSESASGKAAAGLPSRYWISDAWAAP